MGILLANPRPPAQYGKSVPQSWDAPGLLKFWHLASLDAPTVAVAWAWAFAWALHLPLPAWALALLALVVWVIYVGDRLLDARGGLRNPAHHLLQDRHYFHWRHRRLLAPLAAIATLAALWIVQERVSGFAIRQDSMVAAAALVYFSGVHTRASLPGWLRRGAARLVSRELLVGAIFSAGCSLPALSALRLHRPPAFGPALLCVPLFFAALAWLNVRAIADWEDNPWPIHRRIVTRFARAIGVLGLLAALLLAAAGQPRIGLVLAAGALSAFLLALLDRVRPALTPLALRAGADVVLLAPLLLALARPAGA